jgi:hypothetical protein
VLAVATYCEGEIRRDPIKRLMLKDLARFAVHMTLYDLDESATCELVEALAGCPLERTVVREIFRATGGSPLFIEHVLQACSNPKSFRTGQANRRRKCTLD